MSQKEINDSMAERQDKFSTELKQVQDNLTTLKEPTLEQQEDLHTVDQFLEHMDSCEKDDCEVHQKVDMGNKEWFLKGIAIGKRIP